MRRILLLSAVALVMAGVLASPAWAANLTVAKVPQAPKSERLRLTIPRLERVRDIPVYTGGPYDKDKLAAGALHLATPDRIEPRHDSRRRGG